MTSLPNEWTHRRGAVSVVEAVVLAIVLFVLAALTISSYVTMRQRSQDAAARSQVRRAVDAIEAYRDEHGTFARAVPATLARYDASLHVASLRVKAAGDTTYCVEASSAGRTWHQAGPAGEISRGGC